MPQVILGMTKEHDMKGILVVKKLKQEEEENGN